MQKAFGKKSVIFMFLFPALLIYSGFVIVSIVWAGYYSFFDWSGVGEKIFVGFKNYVELLTQDTVFRSTVWHTIVYTIINVAIQVFGGLLFAVLLSRIKRGRVALQTLYYIPVVISSVAICQIFTKLFSVTPIGIVNQILSFINPSFKFMEWISNPQISLYVTAFVEAYKYLGYYNYLQTTNPAKKNEAIAATKDYWNKMLELDPGNTEILEALKTLDSL